MTASEPYVRLSVRTGETEQDGPYEGVPNHLRLPLQYWLEGAFGYRGRGMDTRLMLEVALAARVPVSQTLMDTDLMREILDFIANRPIQFLDVIDAALATYRPFDVSGLRRTLLLGGSVWTVSEDKTPQLVRRVAEADQDIYDRAVTVGDEAAAHLRKAWGLVYGRHPDLADAWTSCVLACEAVLRPVVAPNNSKANLGGLAGDLENQPHLFTFRLVNGKTGVPAIQTLVDMIRLVWPNRARHGGDGIEARTVPEAEAINILQVTVTIVGWVQSGALVRSVPSP